MDINDLHDLRDGKSVRRRRAYNPFIHLQHDAPMMRLLFSITRPAENAPLVKKKAVMRAVVKRAAAATAKPGGSMVSYTKERKNLG